MPTRDRRAPAPAADEGRAAAPAAGHDHPDGGGAPSAEPGAADDRAAELERRFARPVIAAAAASVPAMFLTMMAGPAATVGEVLNYLTLAVFGAESVTLLAVSRDRGRWVREHKFAVGVLLLSIPAVILFVGAVQILRLLQFSRGLRIIRLLRILKAGRLLREKAGLTGRRWTAARAGLGLAGAGFTVVVLSDPQSHTRRFLHEAVGRFGAAPVALGVVVVVALVAVGRWGRRRRAARGGP